MSDKIYTTVKQREDLILATLKSKEATVSEVIDTIWNNMDNDSRILVGWRFFVHLNKLFTILEKKNKIACIGKKEGYMDRLEKVWKVL